MQDIFTKLLRIWFRKKAFFKIMCYNVRSKNFNYRKLKWSYVSEKVAAAVIFPPFLVLNALTFSAKKEFKPDDSSERHFKKLIKTADELFDDEKHEKVCEILYPEKNSMNDEILWRLGRALFKISRDIKDEKQKLSTLEEAFEYVEKALEINEQNGSAHRWYAILLDYVWRYKSTKGRILNSFKMREHMDRAVEINPNDSTSYYLIGEWCYSLAEMAWYERKAASLIFATPPTSTFEEALHYFEKAEQVDPNFYNMNLLMIAKSYMKLNNKTKAIEFLKRVQSYPLKSKEDHEAYNEAIILLKKLGLH